MSTWLAVTALALLVISAALCLVRALQGPSLADRVVALDTLLLVIVAAVAVNAGWTGDPFFVTVGVTTALVSFVATVAVARLVERRGAR